MHTSFDPKDPPSPLAPPPLRVPDGSEKDGPRGNDAQRQPELGDYFFDFDPIHHNTTPPAQVPEHWGGRRRCVLCWLEPCGGDVAGGVAWKKEIQHQEDITNRR